MRIIKFRVWDKAQSSFQEPPIEFCAKDLNWIFANCEKFGLVLQQFTGLKDSDGKDIWEGDICELNFNDGLNENRICRVEYCHGRFSLFYKNDPTLPVWHDYFHKVKVIGNIFENPEFIQ